MEIETLEVAMITMMLIVSAVGVGVRYLRLPYPVALVIAGLALGVLLRGPLPMLRDLELESIRLTPDVILYLLLPPLLFEATLHIEATAFRETLLPVALLAVPGVVLTAVIVGSLVHWGIQLDWPTALLFGAIVAATDPIAVLAIFKRLGAPHGLELIVEGESLFNDGTAVVLARILQGVVLAGTFDVFSGILNFLVVVGGGLIVGFLAGTLASRLTERIDDHLIEITLTTILTFGTFLIAEGLGVSGVIAVVSAGLVMANVGARYGMSPTTRVSLLNFWEYVAFLINSLIFLLIGFQVNLRGLANAIVPISVAVIAVLLARAVVVYGLGLIVLPLPRFLPRRWLHTIFWSGLRGAVSLAVALALPFSLENRFLLLDMTFGVVLFTILIQGLTMQPLLQRLGLVGKSDQYKEYNTRRAQSLMLREARSELQHLAANRALSPRVYRRLNDAYELASKELADELDRLYRNDASLEEEELRSTREHLLRIERAALRRLQHQGLVDGDTAESIANTINARILALEPERSEGPNVDPVEPLSEMPDLDDPVANALSRSQPEEL